MGFRRDAIEQARGGDAIKKKRGHEVEYRMMASDGRTVWIRDTVRLIMETKKVAKLRGLMVDMIERYPEA